jgi:TRAP-type C4-dicarboxylate transport system permease small subunit
VKTLAERWEERADAVLGFAAAGILFALMLLSFVDVVMRYLFNQPIRGGVEVAEMMLLVLIFAGLPLVSHADEHVSMDFIDRMLPPHGADLLMRAVNALCAAVMFFLTWQVWLKAGKVAAYGDVTDVVRIPVAPFVYFMAVMTTLTGLVHVFKVFFPGKDKGPQGTA